MKLDATYKDLDELRSKVDQHRYSLDALTLFHMGFLTNRKLWVGGQICPEMLKIRYLESDFSSKKGPPKLNQGK